MSVFYSQGDIVLVPFPFTDNVSSKRRPAIIISNSSVNKTTDVTLWGNEYETDTIITMDIDFYLDLLLLKSKHKKYSFLNMSKEMFVKSNPIMITEGKISGADKNGDYKTLEIL